MKPDVTSSTLNPLIGVMPIPGLSSDQWEQVCALFERLLDTGDPDLLQSADLDKSVSEAARKLYEQHLKAAHEGFLSEPITLVRSLGSPESPAFSPGQLLALRFSVLRLLGAGGMGEVYLAQDQKLSETVALKTIKPALAREERFRKRFIAEVQSARRVTHANVCRIFDLFEEGETLFYSMQFVAGVRLDEFLAGGPLKMEFARPIVLQLAEGLNAAHQSGVIHGDFKPQNVILLPAVQAPPRAVITDFGLARTFEFGAALANRSIDAGTPDYLAPELAGGQPPSVRSDIYAFGKVAAKLLPSWRHDCCSADPASRPQSLAPLIRELRGTGHTRRWVLAGMGVTAVAGGLVYQKLSAPRFPLPSRQRLILNGFAAAPALEDRASTLRELFLTALRQSPLLAVLPDERLRAVLLALKLPAQLPASLVHLSAAARREKAAMILEGTLERASRGLGLVIRVFLPDQEKPALSFRELVDDEKQVVTLADRAATELRSEFGESRLSLQSSYAPLEQVTSASPEAVDLYFRAVREYERTDTQAGLALLERALAIDPQFALAHHYTAMCLWASSQTEKAMRAAEQAFHLRNRVSERERNWIEFFYYNLTGDYNRSLGSIRKNTVLFPEESIFQRHTASTYCQLRQFEAVIPYNVRAVELDPFSENTRSEHIVNLVSCGKPDEALTTYQRYRAEGASTSLLEWGAGLANLVNGKYDRADECFVKLGSTSRRERWSRILRAGPAILEGRFADAALNLEADLALDTALGEGLRRYQRLQLLSSLRLLMGHVERTRALAAMLCALPVLGPSIRYLREGIRVALEAGDFEVAEEGLARLRSIERQWPSIHSQGGRAQAEGLMMAFRNRPEAEGLLLQALGLWPDPQTLHAVAWWQGRSGDWRAQYSTLNQLLRLRGPVHREDFHSFIVLAWIDQARCLVRMSHLAQASRLYRQILDHWGSNARDYPMVHRIRQEFENLPH